MEQAAAYGKCVMENLNTLNVGVCEAQFKLLKECMKKNVSMPSLVL